MWFVPARGPSDADTEGLSSSMSSSKREDFDFVLNKSILVLLPACRPSIAPAGGAFVPPPFSPSGVQWSSAEGTRERTPRPPPTSGVSAPDAEDGDDNAVKLSPASRPPTRYDYLKLKNESHKHKK